MLEAVQDGLQDVVGVVAEAPVGGAHRVDGMSCVLQDAADLPQRLIRPVVSAASFAFLRCGCNAVGVPFL